MFVQQRTAGSRAAPFLCPEHRLRSLETQDVLSASSCDRAARRARTESAAALGGGAAVDDVEAERSDLRFSRADGSNELCADALPERLESLGAAGELSATRPPSSCSTSESAPLAPSRAACLER